MQRRSSTVAKRPGAEDAAVKVSRHAADATPFFEKYRFAWGDGCFFTMLVSTVHGPIEDKGSKTGWTWSEGSSDKPVTPNAPECWLWVRLANRIDFDPAYTDAFEPPVDLGSAEARLGKWSIAFNLRNVSNGHAGAFFVDEWWKEIDSKSCQGRSRIVVRYILATRHLLATHELSKDITRAPAAQSAVCDPLRYDETGPLSTVPDFDGTIDTSQIKSLGPIYQAILNKGFKDETALQDASGNVTIGVLGRVQGASYTPKIDQMRRAALSALFNAGAWRMRYFEKLGGEFKLAESKKAVRVIPAAAGSLEDVMQQLLNSMFKAAPVGFATSVKESCDAAAKAAYLDYERWVLDGAFTPEERSTYSEALGADTRRNGSDKHFRIWFCGAYYLSAPREENGTTIASLHPLHLTPFDLDVCKSAALLAEQYKTELWNNNVRVERVAGGSVAAS